MGASKDAPLGEQLTDLIELFLLFPRASLLSVGGLRALPLLREDLVGSGVATEQGFVQALAIGIPSTRPNGLYVTSLGYFVLGWPGAIAAPLAAIVPSLLMVPAANLLRRQLLSSWFAGLPREAAITTSGLVIATGIGLISPGVAFLIPPWQFAVTAVATGLTVRGKVHPALLIAVGGALGLALGR